MKRFIDFFPYILVVLLITVIAVISMEFMGITNFMRYENPSSTLFFECEDFSMEVGNSVELKAWVDSSSDYFIEWESSDSNILTVDNGIVHALKKGNAIITVRSSETEDSKSCQITVVDKLEEDNVVSVENISLDKKELTLYIGDYYGLNATIYPTNATNKSIVWSSNDVNVVTVENGMLHAVGSGSAVVTVKTVDKGKIATIKITVKKNNSSEIKVSSVSLNCEKINIYSNDEYNLTASILPNNATNRNVIWKSNNETVATVQNGVVKGVSSGTAVITVKTVDGNKEASCVVIVSDKMVSVTNVSLNSSSVDLYIGKTYTLKATVLPSNATNKTVTWESSNPSVASVNNGVVTAVSKGTAKITVKSNDGKKTATCTVVVSEQVETVDASSITLNKNKIVLAKEQELSIKATVLPSNTTNRSINWSSSDINVATVVNGKIKAIGYGTTTVIARTHNGKTATVTVKVIPPTTAINLGNKSVKSYKTDIILYHPFRTNSNGSAKQSGMQDFDILNFGTSNETYYFISAVNALTDGVEKIGTALEKQELLTAMVFKVPKNKLSNTANSEVMFIKKAGQGQYIAKEPNNNYFWTSGNGGLICSGKDCFYNETEKKYEDCSDRNNNNVLDCTWWGGNNANISRISFGSNSYGEDVTINKYYNYGTIKQKRITMWVAFDWDNNLMAVINGVTGDVYVYDANQAINNGKRVLLYQFVIPKGNSSIGNSISVQGYALNGGYLYRLRGNYNKGIWIEEFDVFGNYVDYISIPVDKVQGNNRAESQGLKIYDNKIYFGIIYRNNCNLSANNGSCASGTMKDIRNSIYYLG